MLKLVRTALDTDLTTRSPPVLTSSQLLVFMEEKFPGCIMREWQGSKVRFEVPHIDEDGRELKLSEMFGELTREKESLDLQEYSLSQTSLEQVFNKFASTQEEESGKVKGMV